MSRGGSGRGVNGPGGGTGAGRFGKSVQEIRDAAAKSKTLPAIRKARESAPVWGQNAAKDAAASAVLPATQEGAQDGDGVVMPFGFEMRADGLYRVPGGDAVPFRLTGPFKIVAESRPETNDEWGLLLEFHDRDGQPHSWIMHRRLLAGEAIEVRQHLAARGLDVSANQRARQGLVDFLAGVKVPTRVRTVPRTGWFTPRNGSPVFVLPGRTIGAEAAGAGAGGAGELVRLDLDPAPIIYGARGTLEGWKREVAAPCLGNSRLIFGLACAFAPPLLPLIGDEGGGVNLRGESSKGKTTIVDAAASVWGPPSKTGPGSFVRQWRTTANALETTAAAHNNTLLPMDEMGQADPRELGDTLYMLANGSGKERARAGGGNRAPTTWLTLVLSSSEESAASMAAQGGRRIKAGQEVRLLDVPALVPGGHGCFEELHGAEGGAAFARAVRGGVAAQHGTAAPAFLAWLAQQLRDDPDFAARVIEQDCRDWMARFLPPDADGQVARAARRLALIAAAGELATDAGVTGWPTGAANEACGRVFRDWLLERGGTGSREDHHLFAAVRRFIAAHGSARFELVRDRTGDSAEQKEPALEAGQKTIMRAGFRWLEEQPTTERDRDEDTAAGERQRVWVHGMDPEIFRAEVAAPLGLEQRDALARLGAAGMIRSEMEGAERRWTIKKKRIPGHRRPRLVVFEPAALDGEGSAGG